MINIANAQQARVASLSSKIDLSHINTDRINREKENDPKEINVQKR